MPLTPTRPNETREMRLVSRIIAESPKVPDGSVAEFIARRRTPGENWLTWTEMSYELRDVLGEIVNDRTLCTWADRYGIPERTKADDTGEVTAKEFQRALTKANIVVH